MTSADSSPVVVSGLGSSGTRVVAQILQELGIHMGDDLNRALDNLLFTLLLKRPRELAAPSLGQRMNRAADLVHVFGRLCRSPGSVTEPGIARELLRASADHIRYGIERPTPARRTVWTGRRLRTAWRSRRHAPGERWGFKEPTAHLFLPAMVQEFPRMSYVHVMRDPRDYAVVPHNQFAIWSRAFPDLSLHGHGSRAAAQLHWWTEMNERAVMYARDRRIRFLAVRLEDLILHPDHGIQQLADFIGHPRNDGIPPGLKSFIRTPASLGRGYALDVSTLGGPSLVARIADMGYDC
ncbi:sulfotransferase [Blastococcus colisei]|nr:sulfotransferase [Blastococcus colisei]